MRKGLLALLVFAILAGLTATVSAGKGRPSKQQGTVPTQPARQGKQAKDKAEKEKAPKEKEPGEACTTIQSGDLLSGRGVVIGTGYDEWGYNYRARKFNGTYCGATWNEDCGESLGEVRLRMKWNRTWLSDRDCDGDGRLDRHPGFVAYRGSGAGLTNHLRGAYDAENGKVCSWNVFVKIKAVPTDAQLLDGVWFDADGKQLGRAIWNDFAVVHDIRSDPCGGAPPIDHTSPEHAGLGGL